MPVPVPVPFFEPGFLVVVVESLGVEPVVEPVVPVPDALEPPAVVLGVVPVVPVVVVESDEEPVVPVVGFAPVVPAGVEPA